MSERRQPPRGAAARRDPPPSQGARRTTEQSGEFRRPDLTATRSAQTVRLAAPPAEHIPRRFSSVQMDAVTAPRSSGRMIDEDIAFEIDLDADGALELDDLSSSLDLRGEWTSSEPPPPSRATGPASVPRGSVPGAPRPVLPPPAPSWPMASAGPRRTTPSSGQRVSDTHAAFVAFAGFGDAPASLLGAPAYAVRVILRKRELRGDLARARVRRSQDVSLYEASMRTADDAAVRNGLVVMAVLLVLAGLLVAAALHFVR